MLRSSLCDYSDVYILVKGTIIVTNTGIAAVPNNRNSKVIFKNYTSFTDCIGEINNTEIDNPRDIAVVMQMYDLTEYSDNCSKTSETIWKYYRDEPIIDNYGNVIKFPDDPDSASFKYKEKITGQAGDNGRKDVQMMVPLKYLGNFWGTL